MAITGVAGATQALEQSGSHADIINATDFEKALAYHHAWICLACDETNGYTLSGFISKPCTPDEFMAKVSEVLSQ